MDTFQQPKITGYRQLNVKEAALMDALKTQLAGAMRNALEEVGGHVADQRKEAAVPRYYTPELIETGKAELARIEAAQPERWIAIARTHFQEGLMALTRAVAQPGSF